MSDELREAVRDFEASLKNANLDVDVLLEVQTALAANNGRDLRKALNGMKGVQSAVYVLNAMKRTGISLNEALRAVGS